MTFCFIVVSGGTTDGRHSDLFAAVQNGAGGNCSNILQTKQTAFLGADIHLSGIGSFSQRCAFIG